MSRNLVVVLLLACFTACSRSSPTGPTSPGGGGTPGGGSTPPSEVVTGTAFDGGSEVFSVDPAQVRADNPSDFAFGRGIKVRVTVTFDPNNPRTGRVSAQAAVSIDGINPVGGDQARWSGTGFTGSETIQTQIVEATLNSDRGVTQTMFILVRLASSQELGGLDTEFARLAVPFTATWHP
ncbi:MAG: hypothetical protein Q8P83_01175 [bacterium]|nr:hypothetical protein [bacterium]